METAKTTSDADVADPADDFVDSLATTLPPPAVVRRRHISLNLFGRTFFLLAVLLLGTSLAWLQTLRVLEVMPRAAQTAHQMASLINLSRAALQHAAPSERAMLLTTMAEQERVRILPRKPSDVLGFFEDSALGEHITTELIQRLGPDTVVASHVNGEEGLWVGFDNKGEQSWLRMDLARLQPTGGQTWLFWLCVVTALSLIAAAAIARLINQPLRHLSYATNRVRDGDFAASRLDEQAVTSEIREVNVGFNRMAHTLEAMEQDRAVMMAGISHDLRTPLARLRLETEMSVADTDARDHMVADIAQLDAIIDKFLDYARPDRVRLTPVVLNDVLGTCLYAVQNQNLQVNVAMPPNVKVMADEVELGRVIANLLENARRYGQAVDTGVAVVDISAKVLDGWVMFQVRDHGLGVPPAILPDLTKPFFRGDASRSAATGAGLGLAIVDKTVQRMGGIFAVTNVLPSGLAAHIQLRKAPGS